MSRSLPTNPSLEQLKKQAKDLRKAHRSADSAAAERIQAHLPRLSSASAGEISKSEFSLQEAQHVIAREYGCKQWEMLQAVVAGDIDSVAQLDDRSTQVLMRELDQAALVVTLKGASEAVQTKFLSNASKRVRTYIQSEIELCNADAEEVESTRQRLLRQLAQLAEADRLEWSFGRASSRPTPGPSNIVWQARRKLDHLNPSDILELWVSIAEQAKREGIFSLESIGGQAVDPFVSEALLLAVDGTEPDLLRDILETRLNRAIMPQQETRGVMMIEALMAIMGGDNPSIVRHKVESLFLVQPREANVEEAPRKWTVNEMADRLSREDLELMSVEQLAKVAADMALLARSEGLDAVGGLSSTLEGKSGIVSQLVRRGLELLPGRDGARMMETLGPMLETRMKALEKAHRMVIEGIAAVQAGAQPQEIAEIVRNHGPAERPGHTEVS